VIRGVRYLNIDRASFEYLNACINIRLMMPRSDIAFYRSPSSPLAKESRQTETESRRREKERAHSVRKSAPSALSDDHAAARYRRAVESELDRSSGGGERPSRQAEWWSK